MPDPPKGEGCFWPSADQWFQIFLAILAVGGTISGAYLGGWMANNNYHEQQKFDKQAAAQQLFIEIKSLNDSLVNYANIYINFNDLRDERGKNIGIYPNINWFLMLNNWDENQSYWCFCMKDHNFNAWQEVSIPTRINNITKFERPDLDNSSIVALGNKTENGWILEAPVEIINVSVIVDNPIIPYLLYNEHGMYYVYETDLSKFDKNLSEDLYLFYNLLGNAESDREYIQNYLDLHPNKRLNKQYFNASYIPHFRLMSPEFSLLKYQNIFK